jgi:hypothetical protein
MRERNVCGRDIFAIPPATPEGLEERHRVDHREVVAVILVVFQQLIAGDAVGGRVAIVLTIEE